MASTNRGQLAYIAESAFGTTPANPALQILRFTSSGLQYTKNTTESSEIDSSRMLTDLIETNVSVGGNIDFELSPSSYDALIKAALCGVMSTAINIPVETASIASNVLTATAGFTHAVSDQWVLLRGWANSQNNGWKRIVSVDPSKNSVTLAAGSVVDEDDTASGTVSGATIKNGTSGSSFSIEESYLDLGASRIFRGMRISSMSLSISTGGILTGGFNFMGMSSDVDESYSAPSWLGTGTRTAASTTSVLNASANVGDIIIDSAVSTACFQSIDLTIENTLREVQCLGSKYPGQINYGRQMVTGSFSKMFVDWATYQKMLDHEDVSLAFGAYNADGGIHVTLPRVKLGSDGVNLSGGNDSDVQESVDFTALKSTDGTHQIRIDIAG